MLINKIRLDELKKNDGFVTIKMLNDFSTETQKYDKLEDRFNMEELGVINPVVNYEKDRYFPFGSLGIYLLNENGNFGLTESGDTFILEQYSENSIGEDKPQRADGVNFKLHFINTGETYGWDEESTNISRIGFNEEDIRYRRERLKNTFIRLSFYDSKDIKSQNLLYYSVIFIDSNKLYDKYIKDGSINNLKVEFNVENPKLTTNMKSSEGFSIYLFKGDVPKNQTKTIYLRIDFNNASNGRTILFTNGKPTRKEGYTMEELLDNLFFEIDCKYDSNSGKNIYFFRGKYTNLNSDEDNKNIKDIINIDAYQVKVI